jgi:hypothetical protein
MGAVLASALAFYAVAGLLTATLFVVFGLDRVLPPETTITWPARLLLLSGSFALWPYVLVRWVSALR